jgi:hypothetical protein
MSKKDFRGQIPEGLNKLVRTVAAVKDQNLTDILVEALEKWLELPENQEVISRHNLKDAPSVRE